MWEKIKSYFKLDIIVSVIVAGIVLFTLYNFANMIINISQITGQNKVQIEEVVKFINDSIEKAQKAQGIQPQEQAKNK